MHRKRACCPGDVLHTCEKEIGEGAELVLSRTRVSARTLFQRVWLTVTPWKINTILNRLSVCILRHLMRQGVSMGSIRGLPAYLALQKAEGSSGMCVAPLLVCACKGGDRKEARVVGSLHAGILRHSETGMTWRSSQSLLPFRLQGIGNRGLTKEATLFMLKFLP